MNSLKYKSICSSQESIVANMCTLKVLPFWFNLLLRSLGNALSPERKISYAYECQSKFRRYSSMPSKEEDHSERKLIFHLEGALLKSESLFPYFFLVAFEAGGPLRALVLFICYPFIFLFSKEVAIKTMVFICFFAMKKENLRIKRSVLPKFFLEDLGCEGYEMIARYRGKIGVSDLPTAMVECFLKDYIGVEAVIGRKLKEAYGYYIGLTDEKINTDALMIEISGQNEKSSLIGFGCTSRPLTKHIFSHFKEIYLVSGAEKRKWRILQRENYPKPLIFHDGRLAFRPTYSATSVMFMWMPFGFFLCIFRLIASTLLPFEIALPILALTGMRGTASGLESISLTDNKAKPRGTVYVCNHRTLLDPIYISMALMKTIPAVTFSISRVSELLSPLRTIRLTRDREEDSETMKNLLCHGDLVICPEGTTCREPYLLRFSPLFAEVSDNIVPVALDLHVSMFYGTTASGLKCLDPLLFLLNPYTSYTVKFLGRLQKSDTCSGGVKSRYEVANYVQSKIADALKFECTSLTRKEKYLILAGNEGIIRN